MQLDVQAALVFFIGLLTINLLFVGFYIVKVLRDISRVAKRAYETIDEVDRTVKDGLAKAKAMEKPLQAIAATTAAITNVVRTGGVLRKATSSILGELMNKREDHKTNAIVNEKQADFGTANSNNTPAYRSDNIENNLKEASTDTDESKPVVTSIGKKLIRPKFFRRS